MMKTSKPALKTSAQEECGVWLDAAQLKGKAKQKRLARPISKMLNPFVGGYSLAVALNFTQTKVEMPKTKQSSISAFFTPQPREVPNKMSTSEVPSMDPVLPSLSSPSTTRTSTVPTPVATGTKRKREVHPDLFNSEPCVEHEWRNENAPEAAVQQEPAERQNMFCEFEEEQIEEINPPQTKRRLTSTSSLPSDSQPVPLAWSQDPLFRPSQYSDGESYTTNQEKQDTTFKHFSDSEPSFVNSLQSEEAFGIRMDVEAATSTQKSSKHIHSSQADDEKENSRFLSPSKHSTLSHIEHFHRGESTEHKSTEPKTASPRKRTPVHLWNKADKGDSKWTKPTTSPRKKPQLSCRVGDEDSLAMLFTQDSEGFRVIAHRGLPARSPLKDQSNRRTVRINAYKAPVEEEEEDDEMLFTQDSQGNLVIKH